LGAGREFEVTLSDDGRVASVVVLGEVDIVSAEALRDTLVRAPGEEVVLRLGGLEFLDARGMAALVEADGILREQGRSLALVDVPPFIRRLFEITDLESVLDIR
jgi:anti-sigma B factor antagonist